MGWGLPCCWQGWFVMATYGFRLACGALVLQTEAYPLAYYSIYIAVLSGLLVIVCLIKGESLRWWRGNK